MYSLNFANVWGDLGVLLYGAGNTLLLTIASGVLGFGSAVLICWVRSAKYRPAKLLLATYVEFIRNTPFLVQTFFVFFGLPTLGLRLTPNMAGLLIMTINISAYSAEIIRGGVDAMPKGYWEAAQSLGLRQTRIFFSVILPPAVQAVYPSLVSQFILLMLGSSVLSSISTTELTSVANDLQNMTFRTTETYIAAAALYLGLSAVLTVVLRNAEKYVFPFVRRRR